MSFRDRVQDYFARTNKLLWLVSFAISIFSLLLIRSASRAYQTNYFKTQLIAILLGYLAAFVLTLIDYRELANFWYLIAGAGLFLMVFTLLFAESVQSSGGINARAWIYIGSISFQPSELVKILFIITFAKHLSVLRERGLLKSFLHVALLGAHALIPMLLCHFQGDDGAAIIFFCMFLFMSFAAGVQFRYFAGIFGAIIIAIPLAWKLDILEEYQKLRFTSMFHLDDPSFDPDIIYQQVQGRISIGSGKFFGRGLFEGPRTGSGIVPFQHSDYIFSVAGEELGFFGCMLILLLLGTLLVLIILSARDSIDTLGTAICIGFFGLVFSQTIINIGMCLALLPVMGVTLPFFTAGGSSAACLYLGLGLVQSVYMHNPKGDRLRRPRKEYILKA